MDFWLMIVDLVIASGTPSPDTLYANCSVPVDEYFWLNSLHPTAPMHRLLAREVVEILR